MIDPQGDEELMFLRKISMAIIDSPNCIQIVTKLNQEGFTALEAVKVIYREKKEAELERRDRNSNWFNLELPDYILRTTTQTFILVFHLEGYLIDIKIAKNEQTERGNINRITG